MRGQICQLCVEDTEKQRRANFRFLRGGWGFVLPEYYFSKGKHGVLKPPFRQQEAANVSFSQNTSFVLEFVFFSLPLKKSGLIQYRE